MGISVRLSSVTFYDLFTLVAMAKPFLVEPLQVVRQPISICDLPHALDGMKLVQLSDLHYDYDYLSDELLSQAIAISNQENPDLVLLTGDYLVYRPSPIYELARRLRSLVSRRGIYAVLGNHDIFPDSTRLAVTHAFTEVGIEVLWNAIATPLGAEFPLVGLADLWSGEFNPDPIFGQLDPSCPRLVLSHNPDTAAILKQWRVDLQLSGHTHGGQIRLPRVGSLPQLLHKCRQALSPAHLQYFPWLKYHFQIVNHWEWDQGLHAIGQNQLYVNRGLGSYFPGRLFCPPEITIFELFCA